MPQPNPLPPSRTARSASGWEWAQVALLWATLSWTTLCLGGLPADTRPVTAALIGALLCVHCVAKAFAPADQDHRWNPLSAVVLPFLAYAAANVLWVSPVRWLGWRDWLDSVQMAVVFWVVVNGIRAPAARRVLFWGMVALAGAAVVLAAYQRGVDPHWLMLGRKQAPQFLTRSSGPFGIPNSLAALLNLLTPALIGCALRRGASPTQRVVCGYLAVVLLTGLVLTISRGASLALAAVLLVWAIAATRGRWYRRAAVALAVLLGVTLLWAGVKTAVPAVQQRLDALVRDHGETSRPIIWRGAWEIIREHPLWGGGAGSFNVLFDAHRPDTFRDEPQWAHNEYLNTASDYGAVGLLLVLAGGLAIVVGMARRSPREDRPEAGAFAVSAGARVRDRTDSWTPPPAALAAGLGAFALQCTVDFNLRIPALAFCAATVTGLWVDTAPIDTAGFAAGSRRAARIVAAALVLVVALVTIRWVIPVYQAEALRVKARRAIDAIPTHQLPPSTWPEIYGTSEAELRHAVALDPANAAAWSDLSYVLALSTATAPERRSALAAEALEAAQRALAESHAVAEFWMRQGIALDMSGRWLDGGRSLVEALKRAPATVSVWYAMAVHLSVERNDPGRALSAVDFCLRLDPSNREAQALRQRLTDRSRAP